jgi:hypothetical protein
MEVDVPEFQYVVEPLPPSRIGRRWRWQLWRGDRLLAGGWNLGERRAHRALRTAASRAAHEHAGVLALRPDRTTVDRPLSRGATVRLVADAAVCLLVPRTLAQPEPSATAA